MPDDFRQWLTVRITDDTGMRVGGAVAGRLEDGLTLEDIPVCSDATPFGRRGSPFAAGVAGAAEPLEATA